MVIYICGVPRSGKTSLARLLNLNLENSSLIVSEAVRNAFQKIDEKNATEWGSKSSAMRKQVFPAFIKEFAEWNSKFSQGNIILDCALIDIATIYSMAGKSDKIICLGFDGKSKEEIFSLIREKESSTDYTHNLSNEKLTSLWGEVDEIDSFNKSFCLANGIDYYDTSKDRESVLNKIINNIKNG